MPDIMKIKGIVCIGDVRHRTEIEVDLESLDGMSEFDARQHVQDLLVKTITAPPLAIIENLDSLSSRLASRRTSSCDQCGRKLTVGRPCLSLREEGFCLGVGR